MCLQIAFQVTFAPISFQFRCLFGPFGLFLGIMDFEAPLTRNPYFYRFEGLDYLIFLVFISEHSIGMTFLAFFVILLIFLGFI